MKKNQALLTYRIHKMLESMKNKLTACKVIPEDVYSWTWHNILKVFKNIVVYYLSDLKNYFDSLTRMIKTNNLNTEQKLQCWLDSCLCIMFIILV